MKNIINAAAIATCLWSSNVFSQIEVGVQCDDCSSTTNSALLQAANYDLITGDKVNVIDMKNGTINSFSINRIINARNGAYIYTPVGTNTSADILLAFNETMANMSEVIQALKAPEADIDITTVSNPCVRGDQKADSVWDLVACVPAVSKLTDRVESGEFTTLGASLLGKLVNLGNAVHIPLLTVTRAFEFDTSDNGKLVFMLTYTVISNDEVSINAEFDYGASRDAEGNPLDASSLKAGTASGGGVYFTAQGVGRAKALQAFLDAAVRLGLVVDVSNPASGQMSCVMSSDVTRLVCTLI